MNARTGAPLRRLFMLQASGDAGDLPALARPGADVSAGGSAATPGA